LQDGCANVLHPFDTAGIRYGHRSAPPAPPFAPEPSDHWKHFNQTCKLALRPTRQRRCQGRPRWIYHFARQSSPSSFGVAIIAGFPIGQAKATGQSGTKPGMARPVRRGKESIR